MAQRFNFPREQVFSDLGLIGAGYKLYTYETGTTTPLATYSDTALSVANANPTIADSAGRFGDIFVNDLRLYKVVLKDADDNTIYTADPVDPKIFSLADFDPRPTSFWGTTAGTADAFTLTADPDVSAYSSTQTFFFACHLDNNAGATMAVINSEETLTALTLKKYDGAGSKVDLEDGDMQAGQTYMARNDGTDIIILGKNPATTTNQGVTYLPERITVANGTDTDHDIDFSGGVANPDDGSRQFRVAALTKQIDSAWAEGDDAGGLDTGSVANDTTYYMFAIYNPTTATADYLFSTSSSSPTLPSGYTKQKRIASLITDGSSNIRTGKYYFNPDGTYRFEYSSTITDVNITSVSTGSRTLYGLTVPSNFIARFTFRGFSQTTNSGTKIIYITDPNLSDTSTPTFQWTQGATEDASVVAYFECGINSLSQIGIKGNDSDPDIDIFTRGWIDYNL